MLNILDVNFIQFVKVNVPGPTKQNQVEIKPIQVNRSKLSLYMYYYHYANSTLKSLFYYIKVISLIKFHSSFVESSTNDRIKLVFLFPQKSFTFVFFDF